MDIQDNKNEQHYFILAHVHHSMKNEYPLNVSVVLSKASGFVVKTSCDCKSRALTRCAHVAAVLLTLVDYTDKHGHRVTNNQPQRLAFGIVAKREQKIRMLSMKPIINLGNLWMEGFTTGIPDQKNLGEKLLVKKSTNL